MLYCTVTYVHRCLPIIIRWPWLVHYAHPLYYCYSFVLWADTQWMVSLSGCPDQLIGLALLPWLHAWRTLATTQGRGSLLCLPFLTETCAAHNSKVSPTECVLSKLCTMGWPQPEVADTADLAQFLCTSLSLPVPCTHFHPPSRSFNDLYPVGGSSIEHGYWNLNSLIRSLFLCVCCWTSFHCTRGCCDNYALYMCSGSM